MVFLKQNQKFLEKNFQLLQDYSRKNHNIHKIIVLNYSNIDLPEKSFEQILFINNKDNLCDKEFFINSLIEVHSHNVILLEAELYTKLKVVQNQIKKLHKCDLLLTNRFSKDSKTIFNNSYYKWKIILTNFFIMLFSGIDYPDTLNINKGFVNSSVIDLMKKVKSNNYFWLELIYLCNNNDIKISECETIYIEKSNHLKILPLLFKLNELLRIKKIKKKH
jgi:hypothetical protein